MSDSRFFNGNDIDSRTRLNFLREELESLRTKFNQPQIELAMVKNALGDDPDNQSLRDAEKSLITRTCDVAYLLADIDKLKNEIRLLEDQLHIEHTETSSQKHSPRKKSPRKETK